MSNISRSKYQKIVEKNKKLLEDIKILTSEELSFEKLETIKKWREAFKKSEELSNLINNALRPEYKKYECDYDRNINDDIIGQSFKLDKNFEGICYMIESIETNKWLSNENYNWLELRSSMDDYPLPYEAKFTNDPLNALRFKTKESAEYFLYFSNSVFLKVGCYIEDICKVTEHEFVSNPVIKY